MEEGIPERLSATDSPLLQAFATDDDGAYRLPSSLDGSQRLYAYSRVGDFPLIIGFGVDEAVVLARWRQDLIWHGLIALVAAMLLSGSVLVALRQSRQLGTAVRSWRSTAEELRHRGRPAAARRGCGGGEGKAAHAIERCHASASGDPGQHGRRRRCLRFRGRRDLLQRLRAADPQARPGRPAGAGPPRRRATGHPDGRYPGKRRGYAGRPPAPRRNGCTGRSCGSRSTTRGRRWYAASAAPHSSTTRAA
jgi:hypothetical protein